MSSTAELFQSCLETQGNAQLLASVFSPFVYTKESSNQKIKIKNPYSLNGRVLSKNGCNNKSAPNKDSTSWKSQQEMQFPHFFRAIGPTKQAIPLRSLLNIRVQGASGEEQEEIKKSPQESTSVRQKKTEKNTPKIHEMITVNQAKRYQKIDSNRQSIDIDSDSQMQLLLFPHSPSSFSSAIPYTITPKNIHKVATNNFFTSVVVPSQHRPLSGQTNSQKIHGKSTLLSRQQQQQQAIFHEESYTQRQAHAAHKDNNESNQEKLANQANGYLPITAATAPKQGVSFFKTERHSNIGVLTPSTAPIYSSKRILSAASLASPPIQHANNTSNFAISQFSPEIECSSPATSPRSSDIMKPKGFSSLKGLFFSPSQKPFLKRKTSGASSTSSKIIDRLLSSERQNDSVLSRNFDFNASTQTGGQLLSEPVKQRQDHQGASREEAVKKSFMRKVMDVEDVSGLKKYSNNSSKIKDIFQIEKGTQFNAADVSPELQHPSVILKHKKSSTGILYPESEHQRKQHGGSSKHNQLLLAGSSTPTHSKQTAFVSQQNSTNNNDSAPNTSKQNTSLNQKQLRKSSNVQIIYPPSMFTTQGYLPHQHQHRGDTIISSKESQHQEKSSLHSKQFKEDTGSLFLKNTPEQHSTILKDKQISLPHSPRTQVASSKAATKPTVVSPRQMAATLNKTKSPDTSTKSLNPPQKVIPPSHQQSGQRVKQGSKLTNKTEDIQIAETNHHHHHLQQEHLPTKQQQQQSPQSNNAISTVQSLTPGVIPDTQAFPLKHSYYFNSKISQQEEVSENMSIYKYTSKSQRVPTSHLEQAATNESYNSKGIIFNKEQRSIGSFKSWDNLEQEDIVENIVGVE